MRPRLIALCVGAAAMLLGARGWTAGFLDDWARMAAITPHGYVCYRASGPIQIDGRLDEPSWDRAPWTEDFADIEGPGKPRPRFRTRAKMLWDDQFFYVAAELEEPHVWGTLTRHDSVIFQDNDFEVFIDPNSDNHEYYEFEMNALNTTWDLLLKRPYKDGGPAINEWEIHGLKTGVQVRGTLNNPRDVDQGWTLEIAFPWKALAEYAHRPSPPQNGDQWRVDFSRVEWQIDIGSGKYQKVPRTREDNWIWSPPGIIDMHRPERWGYVQFTTGKAGRVQFKPDPTGPARDLLQKIYYAQRDFQQKHGHWAASLAELDLASVALPALVRSLSVQPTADGFQASADLKRPQNKLRRLHIRQDSLLWAD
ncbi:MAG: carbohydrate-binding family 9-like protein [Limisphaerales bacterium]